ncbi:MAG: dUTP diphosphatase [Phycisphaerales bacterium]|nr:dUTP diphosphatase [Phycisphaerales bacterium]
MPGPDIRIKRLSSLARLPEYATEGASGMDVHAAIEAPITIPSREIRMIPLGFAISIPVGWEAQVRPRSGLASRHGVSLPNSPGTIDADYRGELKVPLINHGADAFTVEPGMRIAQMVICPVARCQLVEVETLDDTDRGEGGFGSTGTAARS